MCLLNSANPAIALSVQSVADALQELAVNPDGPRAFLDEATLHCEQGQPGAEWPQVDLGWLGQRVRNNSQAKRDAAAYVAQRFASKGQRSFPAIASVPICRRCDNTRQVVIGIDPDDWTGGTELFGPCPVCAVESDVRLFA